MKILSKIDLIMKTKNVSNSKLASLTGLSPMTIGNARKGNNITIGTAALIARALEVSISDLVTIIPTESAA